MKQLIKPTTREQIFNGLNLSIPLLMGLFIFLNPFPHTTSVKEICFYSSIAMIFILTCFKRLDFSFRSPLTIPFILFALWAFIGLFFALDKTNSIHDYFTHLLKYIVFYYIMINYFHSRERLFYLSLIIIISSALCSIGYIVHFYGILGGNSLYKTLVTNNPEVAVNWISIIAIPAAIFSFHNIATENKRYVKAVSAFCLFLTPFIFIIMQARSAILAMFMAVIVLFFNKKKFMVACLGIVLSFTMLTSINDRFTKLDPFISLRLDIHFITYEIIKDYPITGIGYGMKTYGNKKYIDLAAYQKRVPEKYRGEFIHSDPHSIPFSIAVRTGLVGLALLFYILFATFKMSYISIRQEKDDNWGRMLLSAFVAVLVVGFFEPLQNHFSNVIFYTLLAMITSAWKLCTCGRTEGKFTTC